MIRIWISQQNYITNVLNVASITGWRLPTAGANPLDCPGVSCADNEMGYMYYVRGITNVAEGVFINVLDGPYFSGTEPGTDVWWFSFLAGAQDLVSKNVPISQFVAHTWSVHDGDVLPEVPLPAAVWMFGVAILGFMGIRRRRNA